jgi:2-oxoglutarate ferredoxin oxidoreductase subunit alpha
MTEKVVIPAREQIKLVPRHYTKRPPGQYEPYRVYDGQMVPEFAKAGDGYRYHITGLFHDVLGYPTTRLDEIDPWIERVHRKIERNLMDIVQVEEAQHLFPAKKHRNIYQEELDQGDRNTLF